MLFDQTNAAGLTRAHQNPRGDVTPSRVACNAPQILCIPFSIILQTRHFAIVLTLLWASRISYSTKVMTLGWEDSNILNVLAAVLAACYSTQLIYINQLPLLDYWLTSIITRCNHISNKWINHMYVWMAQEKDNCSRCKKAKLQAGIKPTALCSAIDKENLIEFLLDFSILLIQLLHGLCTSFLCLSCDPSCDVMWHYTVTSCHVNVTLVMWHFPALPSV